MEGTTPVWLSMFIDSDSEVGNELSFKAINFGIPISSNSYDYTDSFTGSMILKGKDSKDVRIEMREVIFTIAHGTYSFDGDFVFEYK